MHYFFIGIAGTGMSAIAMYLKGKGNTVSGSDRLFQTEEVSTLKQQFLSMGIHCYKQDSSGLSKAIDVVVISTAIESSNPELILAKEMGISVMKRSELLAQISNEMKTIAIGGTSGKSTTTAMVFHILDCCGYSPSLISGAGLTSLQKKGLIGNAWVGESDWLVIEADESDGSIIYYQASYSVLLNIERDHKEFDELLNLFRTFKGNTRNKFILNADDQRANVLKTEDTLTFGLSDEANFKCSDFIQKGFSISFKINDVDFKMNSLGMHNMLNATAAVAIASQAGITIEQSAAALKSFEGIYRRTQFIGDKKGVMVIDDFAHNPSEIAAAIRACQLIGKRVIAWYQPHGFGPLHFMKDDLVEEISKALREKDMIIFSEVYYAGGTVEKKTDSSDIVNTLVNGGIHAKLISNRTFLSVELKNELHSGDVILLMGARDTSLSDFANSVFESI